MQRMEFIKEFWNATGELMKSYEELNDKKSIEVIKKCRMLADRISNNIELPYDFTKVTEDL